MTSRPGFAFQLADPQSLPALFNPDQINTCVPVACSWLAGRVDAHVLTLIEGFTAAWRPYVNNPKDQLDAQLAKRITYPLIHAFAQATAQSVKEIFAEQALLQTACQDGSQFGISKEDILKIPSKASFLKKAFPKGRFPISSISLCEHLQTVYPMWTSEERQAHASELCETYAASLLTIARGIGLTKADWNPTCDYATFVACLERGPMVIIGRFGEMSYINDSEPYANKSVLGKQVYKWPKGATRLEIPALHAVIFTGIPPQEKGNKLVHFTDSNHPDRVYVISYENLQKSAVPAFPPLFGKSPDFEREATYAFQDPHWSAAPSELKC